MPRMGFLRKRVEPKPLGRDHLRVRTRLERLAPTLIPNERVLASAENFLLPGEAPSLWVVTNRRLHEITDDELHTVLLAEIDEFAHGLRGSEYVMSLAVSNPLARRWSSHTDAGRLLFASPNISDAEALHANLGAMLGV